MRSPERALLVRTPRQHADESPAGYVLRVSESNGYQTPRSLFALAGVARNRMFTLRLDVEALATVLGPNGSSLVGYRPPGATDMFSPMLCGHPLSSGDLDVGVVRICPDCVLERGYLPAWHDLRLVDGCPVHRRLLVTACATCGQKLDWWRPGLLTCRCGANLGAKRGEPLSPTHAELLGAIVGKLEKERLTSTSGLPVKLLDELSLHGLLSLTANIGALGQDTAESGFLANAASLMRDWPVHMSAAMGTRMRLDECDNSATEMRSRARYMSRVLMRGITAQSDVATVRAGIGGLAYRLADLRHAHADSRSPGLRAVTGSLVRSPSAAARGTCRRSPQASAPSTEQALSMRQAAGVIGLPVTVLQYLRSTGHFAARHTTAHVTSVHSADALAFARRLDELGTPLGEWTSASAIAPESVPLAEAFRRKFKYPNGKGELLCAVLDGSLTVVGRQGEGIGNVLLLRHEVEPFVTRARAAVYGGAMTPYEVAQALDCSQAVVPQMVAQGLLVACRVPAGLRVARTSVEQFAAHYRSLAGISHELKTSSYALARHASRLGIETVSFWRGTRSRPEYSRQPFVRVADVPGLVAAVSAARASRNARMEKGVKHAADPAQDGEPMKCCRACGSARTAKGGYTPGGKRRLLCKVCGKSFVETLDPRRLTEDDKARALSLAAEGMRAPAIARTLGRPYRTIHRVLTLRATALS